MGVAPGPSGLDFAGMVEAIQSGAIKALLVHDENPLLNAPGSSVREALDALDALIVIDSVRSTTAELADVVLAEVPFFAKDGTITNADRRVMRQRSAASPAREEHDGLAILGALASALGSDLGAVDATSVMAQAAGRVRGYVPYAQLQSGRTRALGDAAPRSPRVQPVEAATTTRASEGLVLLTGRSLYTSWEGASMRAEEADKLHREEAALLHPFDAEAAGIRSGDALAITDGTNELRITARIDNGIPQGSVFVPQYYDGGAVMAFFPLEGAGSATVTVRVGALQPA
jgi:predicted molibdopterin-dependent oxidoreductase YjgC